MSDNKNLNTNEQDGIEVGGSNEAEAVTPDEITVSAMAQDKKSNTKKHSFLKSRKFKYGTFATAMIALVIIVVIAANMVLSVVSDRFSWSIDFTSTGLYDISDETQEVINSIETDDEIKITVFFDEATYPHMIGEPIKRFANLADIKVTYVNPETNPSALTDMFGTDYNIMQGAVVINNGDRVRVFNIDDYWSQDNDTGSVSILIEDRLAAGLLYVTKPEIPKVYFLTGHGEEGYENLMNAIANNGADVETINLLEDKIDFAQDAKVLVISNPVRDYSATEIRYIEDFLSNDNRLGRNVMYFSSPNAPTLPNLENFLKAWGIAFNDDLVLEGENYSVQQMPNHIVPTYTTEEIMNTGTTLSTVVNLYAPNSRSITTLFDESSTYKTQPVISTSSESYSRDASIVNQDLNKSETDKAGPFDLSVLSMKYKYDSNVQVQSYVLACGSIDMVTSEYFNYFGNGEYFIQMYKLMVDEIDDVIYSARKSTSSPLATITSTEADMFLYITVFAVPVLIIIIGLVVFIRRRFL